MVPDDLLNPEEDTFAANLYCPKYDGSQSNANNPFNLDEDLDQLMQ